MSARSADPLAIIAIVVLALLVAKLVILQCFAS